MKIDRFEDIKAWQKSKELTTVIYKLFRNNRDFSFKDQIQRSSISIMNNIAEGFERKTNKDFKHFLFIAKGSSAEVRSMLDLALELQYLTPSQHKETYSLAEEIAKLLSGFIKKL